MIGGTPHIEPDDRGINITPRFIGRLKWRDYLSHSWRSGVVASKRFLFGKAALPAVFRILAPLLIALTLGALAPGISAHFGLESEFVDSHQKGLLYTTVLVALLYFLTSVVFIILVGPYEAWRAMPLWVDQRREIIIARHEREAEEKLSKAEGETRRLIKTELQDQIRRNLLPSIMSLQTTIFYLTKVKIEGELSLYDLQSAASGVSTAYSQDTSTLGWLATEDALRSVGLSQYVKLTDQYRGKYIKQVHQMRMLSTDISPGLSGEDWTRLSNNMSEWHRCHRRYLTGLDNIASQFGWQGMKVHSDQLNIDLSMMRENPSLRHVFFD